MQFAIQQSLLESSRSQVPLSEQMAGRGRSHPALASVCNWPERLTLNNNLGLFMVFTEIVLCLPHLVFSKRLLYRVRQKWVYIVSTRNTVYSRVVIYCVVRHWTAEPDFCPTLCKLFISYRLPSPSAALTGVSPQTSLVLAVTRVAGNCVSFGTCSIILWPWNSKPPLVCPVAVSLE